MREQRSAKQVVDHALLGEDPGGDVRRVEQVGLDDEVGDQPIQIVQLVVGPALVEQGRHPTAGLPFRIGRAAQALGPRGHGRLAQVDQSAAGLQHHVDGGDSGREGIPRLGCSNWEMYWRL